MAPGRGLGSLWEGLKIHWKATLIVNLRGIRKSWYSRRSYVTPPRICIKRVMTVRPRICIKRVMMTTHMYKTRQDVAISLALVRQMFRLLWLQSAILLDSSCSSPPDFSISLALVGARWCDFSGSGPPDVSICG